jgi:hypothetical protein
MHQPQHAAVFCVDEKSAIQALDRKDRRCRRDVSNGMDSNIIGSARCHYLRH